ncbi:hypothetical protein [Chitinilyticum litopenaei]|uniref:hypothetical protein n=1 Tax=Chitinilyticum litopenaei TaxID=1121276 RepID=UPI00130E1725|nr:hypothetical protein [Chitinilyticum litopenaei]
MNASEVTAESLALIGINGPDIFEVYMWGFGSVIVFWSIGFFVACVVRGIRKA